MTQTEDPAAPRNRQAEGWLNRAAAACSLFLGLGFGLPGAYGTWYLAREGRVWTFLGFPTYGGGLFTRWSVSTTVPLLVSFLAVCAAEVAVGILQWRDDDTAPWLALALLPFELVYWIGFVLPVALLIGLVRTVLTGLVLAGRR